MLLDKLLADRYHAYSIKDMTDYLERELPHYGQEGGVSKRCVEKDIEYMEYDFPVIVEFERYTVDATTGDDRVYKKRCIRYADPTFSIFKRNLTEDEKAILESALTTLGSFDGLDNFKWLAELRNQLKLEERKPVISLSKNLIENSTLIASLFLAISNKQVVELTYRKFLDSTLRKVLLSPYLLKEYNRRWYIIGGAYDTNRILNFALDRIVDIEAKVGYAFKPCETDLDDRFDEIIGVTFNEEAPLSKILFWVSDEVKGYIHTKPIHGSQIYVKGDRADRLHTLYPQLQSGDFFTIECRENFELIRELTAWGDGLIVLTPTPLRCKIADRISRMASRYTTIP
ncbi:MAG: helix-turn-helix transcriptional regulator [Muribaculaceae bacterium]